MADRLKFSFVKLGKIVQKGEVWIDVENPIDHKEIVKKLEAREFARYCIDDQEWDKEEYTFFPSQEPSPPKKPRKVSAKKAA